MTTFIIIPLYLAYQIRFLEYLPSKAIQPVAYEEDAIISETTLDEIQQNGASVLQHVPEEDHYRALLLINMDKSQYPHIEL